MGRLILMTPTIVVVAITATIAMAFMPPLIVVPPVPVTVPNTGGNWDEHGENQ